MNNRKYFYALSSVFTKRFQDSRPIQKLQMKYTYKIKHTRKFTKLYLTYLNIKKIPKSVSCNNCAKIEITSRIVQYYVILASNNP